MTAETLWHISYRSGRPPEVQHFSPDELADPKLPYRLALATLFNEASYRTVSNDDGTTTWYWPRPGGQWWNIPRSLDRAAHDAMMGAVREACRRNGGRAGRREIAAVLRARIGEAEASE